MWMLIELLVVTDEFGTTYAIGANETYNWTSVQRLWLRRLH